MPVHTEIMSLPNFDAQIDAVRAGLSFGYPWSIGDGLSDTYIQLWEISTEPDSLFTPRMRLSERNALSIEESRRQKIVRRLGIMSFAEEEVILRLSHYAEIAGVADPTEAYKSAIEQIRATYDIQEDEIEVRKQQLLKHPLMRPYFYQ